MSVFLYNKFIKSKSNYQGTCFADKSKSKFKSNLYLLYKNGNR